MVPYHIISTRFLNIMQALDLVKSVITCMSSMSVKDVLAAVCAD